MPVSPVAEGKRRIFVLGLPRSGTTLIQSVLNAHPDITGFPESRFYDALTHSSGFAKFGRYALGDKPIRSFLRMGRVRLRTARGRPGPTAVAVAERFFRAANLEAAVPQLHAAGASISELNKIFIETLDAAGTIGWSEKTSAHLFRVPLIEKLVPDARFVHIVRRPEDTLASIWEAGLKYKEWAWVTKGEDGLARLIELCIRGQKVSRRYRDDQRHLIVRYDDFVDNPRRGAEAIAQFCRIPFSEEMLRPSAGAVMTPGESWKQNNAGPIQRSASKFHKVFSEEQIALIEKSLIRTDV